VAPPKFIGIGPLNLDEDEAWEKVMVCCLQRMGGARSGQVDGVYLTTSSTKGATILYRPLKNQYCITGKLLPSPELESVELCVLARPGPC